MTHARHAVTLDQLVPVTALVDHVWILRVSVDPPPPRVRVASNEPVRTAPGVDARAVVTFVCIIYQTRTLVKRVEIMSGKAVVPAPAPKKFGPALPADLAADLPEDEFYR